MGKAFPLEEARELVKRLEFRFTPKHRSWLNISESELSSMTRQCHKGRKIGNIEILREETQAWAEHNNSSQRDVDWQFKVETARTKLASLYPKFR
jgi:hypothetical protein